MMPSAGLFYMRGDATRGAFNPPLVNYRRRLADQEGAASIFRSNLQGRMLFSISLYFLRRLIPFDPDKSGV
jgi:hypothetical protein